MIHDVIESLQLGNISLDIVPMADGGEYSTEVLFKALNCKKIVVPDIVNPYGKKIKSGWRYIADQTGVKINVTGLDSIPSFTFDYKN